MTLVAIGLGAILGAWSRYGLGLLFNHIFPTLPLGTLFANLLGSFIIGLMIVFATEHSLFSPTIRLGIITGFLGALTTFSTFTGEAIHLLGHGQLLWGSIHILSHIGGALLMTTCGIYTARLFFL